VADSAVKPGASMNCAEQTELNMIGLLKSLGELVYLLKWLYAAWAYLTDSKRDAGTQVFGFLLGWLVSLCLGIAAVCQALGRAFPVLA
jgi:hypothetical protein